MGASLASCKAASSRDAGPDDIGADGTQRFFDQQDDCQFVFDNQDPAALRHWFSDSPSGSVSRWDAEFPDRGVEGDVDAAGHAALSEGVGDLGVKFESQRSLEQCRSETLS